MAIRAVASFLHDHQVEILLGVVAACPITKMLLEKSWRECRNVELHVAFRMASIARLWMLSSTIAPSSATADAGRELKLRREPPFAEARG